MKKNTLEAERNNMMLESENWFSNEKFDLDNKISDLNNKISELESELFMLENDNYQIFFYATVDPITYRIFYYIGAGVFVVLALISLIYYLATRRKNI